MQHGEQAWQAPETTQDESDSSTALDYTRQLMQPEWMIDVPENLQSEWCDFSQITSFFKYIV